MSTHNETGNAGSGNATTTAAAEMLRNSNAEGWDVLKFRSLEARDEFYTVGYLEGLATYASISDNWYNVVRNSEAKTIMTKQEKDFVATMVHNTRDLLPKSRFSGLSKPIGRCPGFRSSREPVPLACRRAGQRARRRGLGRRSGRRGAGGRGGRLRR